VAEELNLTPSAISHQIHDLERRLGSALIERDGKGVSLTAFGRRYAREARKALSIIQDAGRTDEAAEPTGQLRISCVPGFAIFRRRGSTT
jgi:LysR family glycine cleavage system transcriptional activator